jgi:hypothetical protein
MPNQGDIILLLYGDAEYSVAKRKRRVPPRLNLIRLQRRCTGIYETFYYPPSLIPSVISIPFDLS